MSSEWIPLIVPDTTPEDIAELQAELSGHINDFDNPHNVTTEQIGALTSGEIQDIYVPYVGALNDVNLGDHSLYAEDLFISLPTGDISLTPLVDGSNTDLHTHDHNDLQNKQGGAWPDIDQFYHLSLDEWLAISHAAYPPTINNPVITTDTYTEHTTDTDNPHEVTADQVGALSSGEIASIYIPYTGASQDVDLGDNLLTVDRIIFNQSPQVGTSGVPGRIYWDSEHQTLALDEPGGPTLQIGQENYIRVVADEAISDGDVVYTSGVSGHFQLVRKAIADSIIEARILGIATQDIAVGEKGFVTTFGIVHGYDTSAWPTNSRMYLSGATPGALTGDLPLSPHLQKTIAYVVESAVDGSIYIAGIPTTPLSSANVNLAHTSNSERNTLMDWFNTYSAGMISGGEITDAGNQTIAIASGAGAIAINDQDTSPLVFANWDGITSSELTDQRVTWVAVDYNDGDPEIVLFEGSGPTDYSVPTQITYQDIFPLGYVTRMDDELYISNNPRRIQDAVGGIMQRFYNTFPLTRDERLGGLILGETGTRNILLSGGALWDRATKFIISPIDTSVGGPPTIANTFSVWYRDGGTGFTEVEDVTQWPNAQYDNGSGTLQNLLPNKYANLWWYLSDTGYLAMVYGRNSYPSAAEAALGSVPPTLPLNIYAHFKLIGRSTFKNGDPTFIAIDSAFSNTFSTSAATSHNNLGGLQGGTAGEYFHLTQAQASVVPSTPVGYNGMVLASNGTVGYWAAASTLLGTSGYSGASGVSGYTGVSGRSGYTGVSGRSGYTGTSGRSGYTGASGTSGYTGTSGQSGYTGISGTSGYTGTSGTSGTSGWTGVSGKSGFSGSGISGYTGVSGTSGFSGSGISGYTGTSGKSGYTGISGTSGQSGYTGVSGIAGASGYTGASGTAGASGYTGASGTSGYTGASGTSGTSGHTGVSGKSGWTGASGAVGASGYTGASGASGYTGVSGLSGYTGTSGQSGYTGASGTSGRSGHTGTSGASGEPGTSGYTGVSGRSGYTGTSGASGESGYTGASGTSGYTGASGTSGWSGTSGVSGFSGSGISGYTGVSGKSGYTGTSGYTGVSGTSGWSGYTGVSGTSGQSGYTGVSGLSGFTGTSGTSGHSGSGISGYTGTSGTSGWSGYTGTSGVSGKSGYTGASGTSGRSGYTGTSGWSGWSGHTGASGTSGYTGASGTSGLSGYTGVSGKSGYTGISGASGTSGHTGASGTSGYTGSSGASGLSGYTGISGTSGFSGSGVSGYTGISGRSGYTTGFPAYFDSTTSAGISNDGSVRFNDADIASVTYVYINSVGADGINYRDAFNNWGASSSSVKGYLYITDIDSATQNFSYFNVGAVTAYTTYIRLRVNSGHAFGTAPVNLNNIRLYFARTGNVGSQGTSGTSGTSGLSGYTGASGTSGYTGASGTSGLSGYTGVSGKSGYTGVSGTSGYTGVSGTSGKSGYTGTSGISGYTGASGSSGWSGYTGASGAIGASGYSGASGQSGYTGASGKSGWSGASGVVGASGYTGTSGIAGASGYTGASGRSGYTGASGAQGASGYTGTSGIAGASGYTGISGKSGYTGYSGRSGYSGSGLSGYSGYSGSGISGYSGYAGDLSLYVPYTGATDDVNLGSHSLELGSPEESTGYNKYQDLILDSIDSASIARRITHYWDGSWQPTDGISFGNGAGSNVKGSYPIAVGYQSGMNSEGNFLTAVGYQAAYDNVGAQVTAFGDNAAYGNSGYQSCFFGSGAGHGNTEHYAAMFGFQTGYNNTGGEPTLFGVFAGHNNTGGAAVHIGPSTGYENTGYFSVLAGIHAGYHNNGGYSTMIGSYAGESSMGGSASFFGSYVGRNNTGSSNSMLGVSTGYTNCGSNNVLIGNNTGSYNQGGYNTFIGHEINNSFNPNTSGDVTFDNTDINTTLSHVTITGHGFGSNDTWKLVKYTEGTASIPSLSDGQVYQVYIVDANTVSFYVNVAGTDYHGVQISDAGSGTGHTLTPQYEYSNVTCIGYGAEATASNQVSIGNGSVTSLLIGGVPLTGVSGYSGYSGAGTSGYSGYSGAGTSGYSGYSGAAGSGSSFAATAYVCKDGNDGNPTGPFLTINAAMTYLTTTFALSSTQHGLVIIMPGVYAEQIAVTSADETRYIDFIGGGQGDVIITSSSTPTVSITQAAAENKFTNLTIDQTGTSGLTDCAFSCTTCADVVLTHCRLTSTRRCTGDVTTNMTLRDCDISSTSAEHAQYMMVNMYGKMFNCYLHSTTMHWYDGRMINDIYGFMKNCTVDGGAGGSYAANAANSGCYIEGCEFWSKSYTFININGGTFINSYIKSDHTYNGGVPINAVNGGFFASCTIEQSGSSGSCVNIWGNGSAYGCNFVASSSSDRCVGYTGSTGVMISCVFLTGSAEYAITGNGGQIVTMGNCSMTAKLPENVYAKEATPRQNKAFFPGQGVGTASGGLGGFQAWFANPSNGAMVPSGVDLTDVNSVGQANSASEGSFVLYTTPATTNDDAGSYETGFDSCNSSYTWRVAIKFKLGSTTNIRFWAGMFPSTPMASATPSLDYMALRADTSASDSNFKFVNDNATGSPTVTDTGVAIDTGEHRLEIVKDIHPGSSVWFRLDDGTPTRVTATYPSNDVDWGLSAMVRTLADSAKSLYIGGMEVRYSY
jgi:hypothetical protein